MRKLQIVIVLLLIVVLGLSLFACGGNSPERYDPPPPAIPSGLTAVSGDSQIALSWSSSDYAAAYNVYYSTSPSVSKSTGMKISNLTGTSTVVTGLTNDVVYYFIVAAINSNSEGAVSDPPVGCAPSASGTFAQSDLEGIWNFNVLVTGAGAKWMRGVATIDSSGNTTVNSFLDSSGGTLAPVDLFTTMTILPDGFVSQTGAAGDFRGFLSTNLYKDILVGTSSLGGASPLIAILQKQVPSVTFSNADVKGTGSLVAGPLTFYYHQISSGSNQEWEYARAQVGQDQTVKYSSIVAPTTRALPGGGTLKVVQLSITSDGIVTETPIAGSLPQPTVLITHGVMSADKMVIVGTANDTSGAFVLRIVQLIHPPSISLTSSTYTLVGLVGSYSLNRLINAASPIWSYGQFTIGSSGDTTFASYRDSNDNSTLPAATTLLLEVGAPYVADPEGVITDSGDTTYHGKISYFKNMIVATKTDSSGVYSLSISLKR